MKFKKSLACTLAVLTLFTLSPIDMGNISVCAAETTMSSPSEQLSFKDKVWGFIKRNKEKIITAVVITAAIVAGYAGYRYATSGSADNAEPKNENNLISGDEEKGIRKKPQKKNKKEKELNLDAKTEGHNFVVDSFNKVLGTKTGKGILWTIGAGGFAISGVASGLHELKRLQRDVDEVFSPYGFFRNLFVSVKKKISDNFFPVVPITPQNSEQNLEQMFKNLKGQDKAKKQLKGFIANIVGEKHLKNIEGQKYSHGDVFYFIGPSGVGKTFAAKGLADYKVLGNDGYYLMSSSDVDLNSADSMIMQIFGPKSDYGFGYSYGGGRESKAPSSLYSYINEHPNGIVIIDEYDKISAAANEAASKRSTMLGDEKGKFKPPLDEVMRGVMDNGKITVCGQELDCSGVTFILTSNETKESLNLSGKESADASLTHLVHDKSITNRLKVVEFENLPIQTYIDIANSQVIPNLKKYFAREECGKINLMVSDETIKTLAERTQINDKKARYLIDDLYGAARSEMNDFIKNVSFKEVMDKDVELKYILRDIDESEKDEAADDISGKTYKLISGAYKYKLEDIESEEIEYAKKDTKFNQYVKTDKGYKKYKLLDLSPEEEQTAKKHIESENPQKLYVKLKGHKKRILEDLTPEEKELIKDEKYVLQNKETYVKIGGEYKKYKLLDVSAKEAIRGKKDQPGLYIKIGNAYKKYALESITNEEEEAIDPEEKSDIYVKADVYKKYDLQEIEPKEETIARKDIDNKVYVIKDPVYKKYVFKAEFK